MTQPAPPANPPPDRPALLTALARVLRDVLVVLGERTRPAGTTPVIPLPLVALIAARLHRLEWRFRALVERALAGTLAPVRPRTRRAAPADARKTPRAPNPLPRAAGWLTKLCPVGWITQRPIGPAVVGIAALLEDERLQSLLASDPRFGRTLRPLWRMLRTEPPPPCLRLPPRPRRPRVPRPKPDLGRPLPRGVTQRDLARSRAMAQPPPQPQPPASPTTPWGTATDWTPTHLTLGRRGSVFDPIVLDRRGRSEGLRRRFGGADGS